MRNSFPRPVRTRLASLTVSVITLTGFCASSSGAVTISVLARKPTHTLRIYPGIKQRIGLGFMQHDGWSFSNTKLGVCGAPHSQADPIWHQSSRPNDENMHDGRGAHSCCVPSSFISSVNTGSHLCEMQRIQAYHFSALSLLSIVLDFTNKKHQ